MMTPEAKSKLSQTIRTLRTRLIESLHHALEGEYLLSLPAQEAGLDARRSALRTRLEDWTREQARSQPAKKQAKAAERALTDVVKQAGYTWLNRLVVIRLLEARGHVKEQVVTGGWNSSGYKAWRQCAGPLVSEGEDQGYMALLEVLCDELASHMPGLFGEVGLVALVPMPALMLRELVEALDEDALQSCWTDDTTLGWIYQYWNDPEREALDAKLNAGGKVEPHEVASKTQMFTEQYMVEWLLHNTLGQTWLAICKKNAWTPEAESRGTLAHLESRRADWRAQRESGEVSLDALMPIHSPEEARWTYWVPQPLPQESVQAAPTSIRDVKLLDPACGSGHFLVGAFALFFAFYKEEASHRKETWSELEIAEQILVLNLHGIDIDPRAVQIAAAALLLTASNASGQMVHPETLNLVAPTLQLAALPKDDPALTELTENLHADAGLPHTLIEELLTTLQGADHLGTLLKVDVAIHDIVARHLGTSQTDIFTSSIGLDEDSESLRSAILSQLDLFLAQHASGADLGLRLRGQQLAAGVRFLQLVRPDSYDIVIGNPPYQGTSKLKESAYIKTHYPHGKADLFACFLERGLQLAKPGGVSAMLTMRNWMFIKQYQALRESLLDTYDLRLLGDFDRGAFEFIADEVVSVSLSIFGKNSPSEMSLSLQPTPLDDTTRDNGRTPRKRAAVLCQIGRFEFRTQDLKGIEGWPLVYWWDDAFLQRYLDADKLGDQSPAKFGLTTGNNGRFNRNLWEVKSNKTFPEYDEKWVSTIQGAKGTVWFEPLRLMINWKLNGFEHSIFSTVSVGANVRNRDKYFKKGIAFSMIGSNFSGRLHKYPGVFGNMGSSFFPENNVYNSLLSMNTSYAKKILNSLNPTVHYEVGDVNRLPLQNIEHSEDIYTQIELAFDEHEAARENSVEFIKLGASCWEYAQEWAQLAVDREEGEPLPEWEPVYEEPEPAHWVSWGVGVALGRFDATQGLVNETPEGALPAGILFVSEVEGDDGLAHPACELLQKQWHAHSEAINEANGTKAKEELNTWLRKRFFADVHRQMYENAPIYFPLSSAKKSFVAFVSIHRWTPDTLRILQADWLLPEKTRIEGQIEDVMAMPEEERSRQEDKQLDMLKTWLAELEEFIAQVNQCAEFGPPQPDHKTPEREVDARYEPVLDDGTLINASALWPLLQPQWTYPKKWWKELVLAKGRKDYDWSLLAGRYFPTRVDDKCKEDPSLAVAHGCFWRYHPDKAYAWELRLQDEIEPDFTLDEPDSDTCRAQFIAQHPDRAKEIEEDEEKRRAKNRKKSEDRDEGEQDDDAVQPSLDL